MKWWRRSLIQVFNVRGSAESSRDSRFSLASRPVVNHLVAPVVGHLLPRPNFIECAKTPDAQFGLAIEGTDIDARRPDCHGSGCRV
jgi:hypothetical protein